MFLGKHKARSIEAREDELIALAVDLAEKQLEEGTASSQVITHYLKLGTQKERLERKLLEEQVKLTEAKTANLNMQKELESLYKDAVAAMRNYRSSPSESEDYD